MRVLTTTPPTAWVIEIYVINGVFVRNVTVDGPGTNMTVLTSLSPGTVYMIRVAGISVRGVGNYTDFATAQTYQGTIVCLSEYHK